MAMSENEAIKSLELCKRSRIFIPSNSVLDMAIQALEEIQQYRAIGTVEEFKALKEKNVAKKPILSKEQNVRYVKKYDCPSCGKSFTGTCSKSCYHCGQALDWE